MLLAQDAAGLANLQRLSSLGFLQPTRLTPQLPLDDDRSTTRDGLILLTGGTRGPLARLLAEGQRAGGRGAAGALGRGVPGPLP